MDFNNKTILITGGAGFIGSNLALFFQENYPDAKVVVFDTFQTNEKFENGNRKSLGHYENLIDFRGEIVAGDLNSKEDLNRLRYFNFDYIFHQAAISDTTVLDQNIMLRTNLNAFKDILQMAKEMKSNVVYASSGATYGDAKAPQRVGVESPNNIYGFSKLAMDNLAYEWIKRESFPIVGLRYFNVYGNREFHKGKTASMVLQFGLQILRGENPKLFEGSDKIFRDFVYIKDIIQANIKATNPKASGVYNVGTGKARTFQDIVDILKDKLSIDFTPEYIPNPYKNQYQFFTQADIEPTREFLGYAPEFTLEAGIGNYTPDIRAIFKKKFQE
jgi:ADP-L-glycero-D-manno-heptose 6-epimerase